MSMFQAGQINVQDSTVTQWVDKKNINKIVVPVAIGTSIVTSVVSAVLTAVTMQMLGL